MKKLIFLLLLAGGLGGGYKYYENLKQEEEKKKQEIKIETVPVTQGDISLVVNTTGRVVSNFDVEIKCKASGQIIKLPFEVSQKVTQGKLLVELDPIDEKRGVEQAKVALLASQARLEQAKKNYLIAEKKLVVEQQRAQAALESAQATHNDSQAKAKRLETLIKTNLTSREDYEAARAMAIKAKSDLDQANLRLKELKIELISLEVRQQDIVLAETQVKSNQVDLSVAEQRLSDTQVFSPIEGVVTEQNVQIGQIISSGISNVGGGTSVLTLSDLSRMFVLASVDESDIGKVQVNQKAIITADAFSEAKFRGKVVRIATRGVNTSNVVTFEVKIEVLGKGKNLLKPEMTTNINIIAAEKKEVLLVPSETVFKRTPSRRSKNVKKESKKGEKVKRPKDRAENPLPEQKEKNENSEKKPARKGPIYFVKVLYKKDVIKEVEVEIGINDGLQTEIISGLDGTEKIVIEKEEAQSRWRRSSGRSKGRSNLRAGRMMMRSRGK